jgi:hypothetical protein
MKEKIEKIDIHIRYLCEQRGNNRKKELLGPCCSLLNLLSITNTQLEKISCLITNRPVPFDHHVTTRYKLEHSKCLTSSKQNNVSQTVIIVPGVILCFDRIRKS